MKNNTCLVFIDDSGDPGFKVSKGSSSVFVIALVIFDDNLIAEEVALAIKKLRRELKFSDQIEFKFHKSRIEVKRKFLETVAPFDFKIRAIIVDKSKIYNNKLRRDVDSFFNYVVMSVLKYNGGTIKNAKLKFDKRGEKRVRNELRAYLSSQLDNKNNQVFSDLKFVDSKENNLIQLADMVAGTIASHYKNKNSELLTIIKKRIQDIWEFK